MLTVYPAFTSALPSASFCLLHAYDQVSLRFLRCKFSVKHALGNGARDVASSYDVGTACKKAPSDHTAAARLYHGLSPHIRLGRWAVLTHAKAQGRRPPPSALGRPPPPQTSPSSPAPCAPTLPKRLPRARPLLSRALCLPYLPPSPYDPPPYDPEVESFEGPWLPLSHFHGPDMVSLVAGWACSWRF